VVGSAVIALLGLASAITASETKGDEFYYVMIFGSQSEPEVPNRSAKPSLARGSLASGPHVTR
jgi:hypothetical protein